MTRTIDRAGGDRHRWRPRDRAHPGADACCRGDGGCGQRSHSGPTGRNRQVDRSGRGRALALPADVSDRTTVERLLQEVECRLGPVSLLINNAGREGPLGPIWEVDPDAW